MRNNQNEDRAVFGKGPYNLRKGFEKYYEYYEVGSTYSSAKIDKNKGISKCLYEWKKQRT